MDKQRKSKKIRIDDLTDGTTEDGMIEPKSEIEFGDQTCQQSCQQSGEYGHSGGEYGKAHQRMTYESAGPSNVQQHGDEWLDDKHFMASNAANTSDASTGSSQETDQQRCKTKNFKALEPCSCPLCARVYSNVSNLRQHMRLIHNPTSVCCPLCQKSFTSDLYLKRHYLSMHGGALPVQPTSNPQPNNTNSNQTQLQSTHNSSQQQQQAQTTQANTQQQVSFDYCVSLYQL